MRFLVAAVAVLAADTVVASSSWFGRTVYNKWHETELERWLSDHGVPYPTPADRKDLENLVKDNWNAKVVSPFSSWSPAELQAYLQERGQTVKKGTEKNKDSLVTQVKQHWYETENEANDAYANVRDWIFDTWSDSQLKSFLDRHGIPNPNPRTKDSLLQTARENYQTVANKLGENYYYPGNWLYESWSDSDLKAWFDERGIPVPQPTTRDQLIATIRRNSRDASKRSSAALSAASASAAAAQASLSDALFDSWSDSTLKQWFDKNGIKVPQGSKRNELLALARKHSARLVGDSVSATLSSLSGSAASAYGAATSSAGNEYARATDDAYRGSQYAAGGIAYYVDLVKQKIGLASSNASSALSSATSAAAKSASSASAAASGKAASASAAAAKSASSASAAASKKAASASAAAASSASSASKSASKSAQKVADAAAESVSKAKHRAEEKAQKATDYAKEEL